MTLDPSALAARAAPAGTLFYQMGTAGAQRVPAPAVDVAPSLVRGRASGDRLALSGVSRWMADLGQRTEDERAARGMAPERADIEALVRRRFLAEGGTDATALAPYGPGGPDDRRRRSPYAGSADAAFLEYAGSRPAHGGRGSAPDATIDQPDGGFKVRRGWDMAQVSGAALRMLALYGESVGVAKAA
jgi:hypothetical protein